MIRRKAVRGNWIDHAEMIGSNATRPLPGAAKSQSGSPSSGFPDRSTARLRDTHDPIGRHSAVLSGSLHQVELADAGGRIDLPVDRVIAVAARLKRVADVLRTDHVQRRRATAGDLDRPAGNIERARNL